MQAFKTIGQALVLCACSLGLSSTALAVQAEADTQNVIEQRDGVRVYAPAFFAPYNPKSAEDMVQRVPGFSIQGGDESRGLAGNLSNVLINGRRPSTKQGPRALLERLPASAVLSIELITAPQPGIEMAGFDQLVNLTIDRSGQLTGAWEIVARIFEDNQTGQRFEGSVTRANANSTLTLGLGTNVWQPRETTKVSEFTAQRDLLRRENQTEQQRFFEFKPSVSYERILEPGHTLRVDAEARYYRDTVTELGRGFSPDGAALDNFSGQREAEGADSNLTLDFDYRIDDAWSLKLTGYQLYNYQESDELFVFDTLTGSDFERVEVVQDRTDAESILRSQIRYQPSTVHTTTLATEFAYNLLEQNLQIFEGVDRTPVQLAVANTTVDELRFDINLTHVWTPIDNWSFESTFGWEASRISQSGDAEQERDLNYFKPAFVARWTPTSQDQISLGVSRRVSQLNFGEFASSVDIEDDTTDVGNPNLEPERRTRLEVEWQRRFWQSGAFELRAVYDWAQGVPDLIPLGNGNEGPGNLGDGTQYIISSTLTSPLDRFGVPGGLLALEARYRDNQVDDPVTGESRRWRGDDLWRGEIEFRQDIPDSPWSWSFEYEVSSAREFYRIDSFTRFTPQTGNLQLNIDRQLTPSLRARLGSFLNLGESERERFFWPTTRASGSFDEIELRQSQDNAFIYAMLLGTF